MLFSPIKDISLSQNSMQISLMFKYILLAIKNHLQSIIMDLWSPAYDSCALTWIFLEKATVSTLKYHQIDAGCINCFFLQFSNHYPIFSHMCAFQCVDSLLAAHRNKSDPTSHRHSAELQRFWISFLLTNVDENYRCSWALKCHQANSEEHLLWEVGFLFLRPNFQEQ